MMVDEKRDLLNRIAKIKRKMDRTHFSWQSPAKKAIEGRADWKRPRRRKLSRMLNDLAEDCSTHMRLLAENRKSLRNWMSRRICREANN